MSRFVESLDQDAFIGAIAGVLDRALPPAAGGRMVNLAHGGRYALGSDNLGDLTLELSHGHTAETADPTLIWCRERRVLAAGDTLVLSGLPEPLALAEEKLLRG